MGENRTVAAEASKYASLRRRAAARTGPPGHGRNLVRVADGLSVERTERHRHLFQQHGPSTVPEWVEAGVFLKLWSMGLRKYDELLGIDWSWQSMDGAMTKAPLGGGKNRPKPHGSGQKRRQAKSVDRGGRRADRLGD